MAETKETNLSQFWYDSCELIDIKKFVPNGYNPNRMSEADFEGLVESIQTAGFFEANPILARPKEDGVFEIVDGEHRWKAAKQLGIDKIPAKIQELSDFEAHRLCLILNKPRGSEWYFLVSKLLNEDYEKFGHGKNQKWLGEQYGYDRRTVSEILYIYPRLKSADMSALSAFSNRDLARIARVENDRFRYALVERAVEMDSLSIQTVASRCNKVADYIDEKTETYLFSWEDIPGDDSGKLLDFLDKTFNMDWIKDAKIEKIDDGSTIRVYTEKSSLSLKLNDEKTEVKIELKGGEVG